MRDNSLKDEAIEILTDSFLEEEVDFPVSRPVKKGSKAPKLVIGEDEG